MSWCARISASARIAASDQWRSIAPCADACARIAGDLVRDRAYGIYESLHSSAILVAATGVINRILVRRVITWRMYAYLLVAASLA